MKRHGFAGVGAPTVLTATTASPAPSVPAPPPAASFKGLRMAGRMGHARRTVQNLKIRGVDVDKGVLLVNGAIPGPKGSVVVVRTAVKGA